jgi:hypothetical protein
MYDSRKLIEKEVTICGMQFENIEAQQIMWTKFNHTMLKHMYHEPNFKGFMVDNA